MELTNINHLQPLLGWEQQNDHDLPSDQSHIFNLSYPVEPLPSPEKFLPQYQQNQQVQQSFLELFLNKVGSYSVWCGYAFALCGIKCHLCIHELQSSMGTECIITVGVVEHFGQFNRMLKPGLNFINPCSEKVKQIDMKIGILEVGETDAITKDNVRLTLNSSVAYRITNPIQAIYVLDSELQNAIIQLTASSLRSIAGIHLVEQIIRDRNNIIEQVRKQVLKNIAKGITIEYIFIEEILVPPDIQRGLSSVARQKRISQAALIDTKGDVESAQLMRQCSQLLDTKAAMQVRYLQVVEQLAQHQTTLVMGIGVHSNL